MKPETAKIGLIKGRIRRKGSEKESGDGSFSLDEVLAQLREEVNTALASIDLSQEGISARRNAFCWEVGLVIGEDDDVRWVVKVGGASPENPLLKTSIAMALLAKGFPGVEVVCEW